MVATLSALTIEITGESYRAAKQRNLKKLATHKKYA